MLLREDSLMLHRDTVLAKDLGDIQHEARGFIRLYGFMIVEITQVQGTFVRRSISLLLHLLFVFHVM